MKSLLSCILLLIYSYSTFARPLQVLELENVLDQEKKTYKVRYKYENTNYDDFEYLLIAKSGEASLEIKYTSKNLSTLKIESGTIFFPKTNLEKVTLSQMSNGAFFLPTLVKNAVIRLHGSEGGKSAFSHAKTFFMALNGYASYAYCYFNCPFENAPENLHDVEVKKIYDDMLILKRDYKVALWGGSRGAELVASLATILTSENLLSPADAYISDRPAHIVVPAFFYYYQDPANWRNGEFGKVPYDENWIGSEDGPHIVKQGWLWDGMMTFFPNYQAIQVEKSQSPFLNIHGTSDSTWPVSFSVELEKRIDETNRERFLHRERSSSVTSSKKFQFHYFNGVDHDFKPIWSQILREKLTLDFLDQRM